jgi:hypothetical protein
MTGPRTPKRIPTDPAAPDPERVPEPAPLDPRPLIERIGLALIAAILVAVFGVIAAASFASGEMFLALMAGIGALMTAWAGGRTLFRG